MLKIFVPKETTAGETRVAASVETTTKLVKAGFLVSFEAGAGLGSSIIDPQFSAAGATIVPDVAEGYAAADLVLKLHPPAIHPRTGAHEAEMLRPGAALVSFLYPNTQKELVERLLAQKISSFAMDLVPRITRAQKMDALSSQSNIAGYKSVLLAAQHLPKMFPMMMTAAGTITPAKVVILGAGVAGLQAIATAKRLGALVEVSDIRPQVKEQVESLGARFIDVPTDSTAQDQGGYAREASAEFKRRQEEELRKRLRVADVVITTALIPGKPAPKLLSADMVREMPLGSVVVDIASDQGGNCELTQPGEVVACNGVTIIGLCNVASLVPVHATEVYARNVLALVQHLTKAGEWALDLNDEIVQGTLVTHQGRLLHKSVAEALKIPLPA